jgi:replicative DNA helicase
MPPDEDVVAAARAWVGELGYGLETVVLEQTLTHVFGLDALSVIELVDLGVDLRGERQVNGAGPSSDPPAEAVPREVREISADRVVDGAAFVLDAAAETEDVAVWGDGTAGRILWASGEALMIVAPQGVGKTTLGQRLALARIGLCPQILGFPVPRDPGRVLYIAADRPRQAQRSLARMVDERDRQALAERLRVWPGPLPFSLSDPSAAPDRIVNLCHSYGAGTVVIDSLKDVAVGLSSEETGGRVALALQALVAGGIEVVVLHHQRKSKPDAPAPKSLDDVYGSTWITSACGSVLLLWGSPGDTYVELRHLKQPMEDVGPLTIEHDHVRGLPAIVGEVNLEDVLRGAGVEGLTVAAAAKVLLGKAAPSKNDVEKARRRLDRLAQLGRATHVPSLIPTDAGRYVYNGGGAEERERA